jgi:hypothetical protein
MLFRALQTRWSPKLNIYPNLPLTNIIGGDSASLAPNEVRFLRSTSVDYTLCDRSDRPILSIEFDGLGEGFSRSGNYVPRFVTTKDPNRLWKLNFKLKIYESHFYPLFVVSFPEATPLGSDLSLAVVDGIIGYALAGLSTQARIDDQIEALHGLGSAGREFVEDLVMGAEVEMRMEWDPIYRKVSEIQDALIQHEPRLKWSVRGLDPSEVTHTAARSPHPEIARDRMRAFEEAQRLGHEVSVETTRGTITESVWVRNVGDWLMASTISEGIAELLAFKKALALYQVAA